ncbi:MAG: cysteine desulfurase family protein [Spirosomataceae bacterium]
MDYPIYLDYNATTPIDKRVLDTMMPYLTEHFGNAASRSHAYGWKAEEAVSTARQQIADLLGCSVKEIVFTSGATESINLALKGFFEMKVSSSHITLERESHFITLATEHKAVLDTMARLEKLGAEVSYLPVKSDGLVDLEVFKSAFKPNTALVSIMWANNEIGVIQPIEQLAEITHQNGAVFHTDATQAVGKIPIDIQNIDLLSFSGHKIYAPKGVGVLYVKKNVKLTAQQDGGRHERGLRSGTLNVPSIVGLGTACEIAAQESNEESERLRILRDKLEIGITSNIKGTHVNGNLENRLSHVSNISFEGVDGEMLLMNLNKIAVSNGSACNSASTEPSYLLKALGHSDDLAYSSVRFSLGRFTTESDIDLAIAHVKEVIQKMR